MNAQTIGNAVATRDNSPSAMVKQYAEEFTGVLPTHIRGEQWLRVARAALKKGKKNGNGLTDLEVAAANNPGVFLAELRNAARMGLEPGTEQFYLTPRKVKGQLEILGITGYQGYIELMYRAGAVSSVIAECVYSNDQFEYAPGANERPVHTIDWDADDRGTLRLAYAYAIMKDGATSKVVVMNKAAIAKIKASAQGASSEYSPWVQHEDAMWLKSAVRQLAKWVPTSNEVRVLSAHQAANEIPAAAPQQTPYRAPEEQIDHETGEVIDAELEPENGWPETKDVPA